MNAKFMFLMALVVMTVAPVASANDRHAQIMRAENVPPAVLADRVEACLRTDPAGTTCKPEGSNATAAQIWEMVHANPQLPDNRKPQTVRDLPKFLRALTPMTFPRDLELCLAGMNGTELAASCRHLRGPRDEREQLWTDGTTIVLAGNCLNGVVPVTAATLGAVQVYGTPWQRPADRTFTPFAGVNTSGPQCSEATVRLTGVHVFTERAYETECAQRYVHNPSRYTSGRGRVGSYVSTGREDVFSLQCGKDLHAAQRAGTVPFSTQNHRVELLLVQDGGAAIPIFSGTVRGNVLTPASENDATLLTEDGLFVDVPDQFQTGTLVWNFPEGGMISPTESGAGMDIRRLESSQGCRRKVKVASAIEGNGDGFAYDN